MGGERDRRQTETERETIENRDRQRDRQTERNCHCKGGLKFVIGRMMKYTCTFSICGKNKRVLTEDRDDDASGVSRIC